MAGCTGNYIALFVTEETRFMIGEIYEKYIEWSSWK